jgi:hypothetical protein
VLTALALCVLGQLQTAAPLEFDAHEPIEVTSAFPVAEGWEADHDWLIDRPARGRQYNDGGLFAVWGPPGKYEVRHKVYAVHWEQRKRQSKVEYVTIIIRGGPEPEPVPPPDPIVPTPDADLSSLARRWASDLDPSVRRQLQSLYQQTATDLSNGDLPTIARAFNSLKASEISKAYHAKVVAEYLRREQKVKDSDSPRQAVVDFLQAISSGLGGS